MGKEHKQGKLKPRDAAGSMQLELKEGDAIRCMWSTPDGLMIISKWRIVMVRTPECIDPKREHDDAPWQQSILFEAGTESALVARTVVQVQQFLERILPKEDDRHRSIFDVAFRVMKSELSLERILKRIVHTTDAQAELVSASIDEFIKGRAPRPVPPNPALEDDFKAFVLEVRQCLNHITDLFEPTLGVAIKPGRFNQARSALEERFGEELSIHKMLKGDAKWIELWIALANTFKHPKPGERLTVNDMRLLPSRQIQLPTWQLEHPKLNLERPQALSDSCEIAITNLLGLFENLFVELIGGLFPELPAGLQWVVEDHNAADRNPIAPARYTLSIAEVSAA